VVKTAFDVRRDRGQIRLVIDCFTERGQDHRRRLDRRQALALHVGDDQPGVPGPGDDVVQVAADPRRRRGRDVAHGEPQLADLARHPMQEDTLRDVGHRPDIDQFPFLALARGAGDHRRPGDTRDRGAGHEGVRRPTDAVVGGEHHAEDDRHAAGEHRPGRPQRDRRQGGAERQQ
jgi:hypothetical protein